MNHSSKSAFMSFLEASMLLATSIKLNSLWGGNSSTCYLAYEQKILLIVSHILGYFIG